MKLIGLLQKCSFFFRSDWKLAARGCRLYETTNVEGLDRQRQRRYPPFRRG